MISDPEKIVHAVSRIAAQTVYVRTRSPDVEIVTVVGIGGLCIVDGGGADGNDIGTAGRGTTGNIHIPIICGRDSGDAGCEEV